MSASVLINTSDAALANAIRSRLRASGVGVAICRPGISFMQAARRERPEVALLDAIEGRVDAAQMEIEVLRDLSQDVRIIVVSRKPSERDAWVVERGIFFYMAAPELDEVVRVLEAGAGVSRELDSTRSDT
jgi:DNA-binding response OmpR family regulator